MSHIDEMFGRWGDGDPADYGDSDGPADVECKRCGKGGLHWEETDDGWQLYENYRRHECDPARLHKIAADDFDAI